jgi:hypothetical protein
MVGAEYLPPGAAFDLKKIKYMIAAPDPLHTHGGNKKIVFIPWAKNTPFQDALGNGKNAKIE